MPFAWRRNRIVFNKSRAYVITLRGWWDEASIGRTTLSAGFRRAGTESVRLVGGNVLVVCSFEFPFQVWPELF